MLASTALVLAAAGKSNVAIVGGHFPASASLASRLRTNWALVPASEVNASVVASATAFIEAPLPMLANAVNGVLYQYEFTGPPCCHQLLTESILLAFAHTPRFVHFEYCSMQ